MNTDGDREKRQRHVGTKCKAATDGRGGEEDKKRGRESFSGAELLRQIARHRALIDEPGDIAEQVIDSSEPTETAPEPS